MNAFANAIGKWLMPISSKIAQNRYIQILMNSFLNCIPLIVCGAFCLIISKPLLAPTAFAEGSMWFDFFTGWQNFCNTYMTTIKMVNSFTLGSLSFCIVAALGYNWGKQFDLHPVHSVIVPLVSFFLINCQIIDGNMTMTYFGGSGLFTAIFAAFFSLAVFTYLCRKGLEIIKMPETVPANLTQSIKSLVPLTLTFICVAIVSGICIIGFGKTLPQLLASASELVQFGFNNIFAACGYYLISSITWWFGIHDEAILALFSPIMWANLSANAEAYAAGTELPYIVSMGFKSFVAIGGSGGTLGLVICLMRSKSETLKAVGKISIAPAMFGINEPVIFGLPIMLNPLYLIPFLISPVVQTLISYSAFSFHFVSTPAFYLGGTSPEILKQFFATTDWKAIVLWVILVAVQVCIWYPFVKIDEKAKLDEERALANDAEVSA